MTPQSSRQAPRPVIVVPSLGYSPPALHRSTRAAHSRESGFVLWDVASTLRLTAKQRMYGPAARLKMISEVANVRSCINVSDLWSGANLAPGHDGYPRASRAHYRKDFCEPNLCQALWLRRADRSSISSCHRADLGGKLLNFVSFTARPLLLAGLREAIPAEPPSLTHPNR